MLFAPQNLPKPIRVQGAFVSDEERDSVVSFLKEQSNGPSYNEEVTKHIDTAPVPGAKNDSNTAHGGAPEQDELFVEAARFIIEKDKASIGLLQRMSELALTVQHELWTSFRMRVLSDRKKVPNRDRF